MSTTIAAAAASYKALYGGYWRRVAAAFLDLVVVMLAFTVIIMFLDLIVARLAPTLVFLIIDFGDVVFAIAAVVFVVLYFGYSTYLNSSSWQATPGKLAMGVKVTDLEGKRISFLRSVGRFFAMFFSNVTLGIGYVIAAFTDKRQTLHDIVAGTLVVRKDAAPEEIIAGGASMPTTPGMWVCVAAFAVVAVVFNLA